jgi:methionyl aminopeptidase
MVNAGGAPVRQLDDGWTVVTLDGSLSAHFEHTVAVTGAGPLVLTARGDERFDEVLAGAGFATADEVGARWRKTTR